MLTDLQRQIHANLIPYKLLIEKNTYIQLLTAYSKKYSQKITQEADFWLEHPLHCKKNASY